MKWTACLATMVVLSGQTSARGDEIEQARPSLEQLLKQLGDRDYRVRQSASRAIQALGSAALPELRKALAHPDAEVRQRVGLWIPVLERTQILEPKRVTLNLRGRPVRAVFDALAKQSGFKIELLGNPENEKQVIDFTVVNLPFWQALDRLSNQVGVTLENGYGDAAVHLQFGDRLTPYVHYDGIFRLVANSFDYGRSIRFGSLPRNPVAGESNFSEYLVFRFAIGVEPRLPILSVREPRLLAAIDDEGHSMLPSGDNDGRHRSFRRGFYHHFSAGYQTQTNLSRVSRTAKNVRRLHGVVPVTLLVEQKPVVVTDRILEAKGKKLFVGPVTFDIEDVSKKSKDGYYVVKMTLTSQEVGDGSDAFSSFQNRIELQDAKGEKYQVQGSSASHNGNCVNLSLTFGAEGAAGPPVKLIYSVWKTIEHEAKFDFHDLPLP